MKNSFVFALALLVFSTLACGSKSGGTSPSTAVEGATPTSDGTSPKLLKAPAHDLGPMDPTPVAAPASAPAKTPEAIEVSAHAIETLTVKPTSSGNEKIISSLTASLQVDKIEPQVANPILNLAGITNGTIVTPDIGKCELLAKNFDMRDAGKTIAFTLMGMDDKTEPSAEGCLVKLSTMAMAGFVVEFKNVRLGGPLSETYVPTVRLSVAPVKTDEQK